MNWLELARRRNPRPALAQVPDRFKDAKVSELWPGTLRDVSGEYIANVETLLAEGIAPLFVGKAGTGKTLAATAIFRVINEYHKIDAHWASAPSLFFELVRLNWRAQDVIRNLCEIPYLFIDDIGVIKVNTPAFDIWMDILSQRFDAMRPIMYTANLRVDTADPFSTLADLYGPLVARRLQKGSGDFALSLLSD